MKVKKHSEQINEINHNSLINPDFKLNAMDSIRTMAILVLKGTLGGRAQLLLDLHSCVKFEVWALVQGQIQRGLPPGRTPLYFAEIGHLIFCWRPMQAKRMHQIMPTDFENYNFSLLLLGHIPLRHPLSPQALKFCQSLIWVPPSFKKSWIRPCGAHTFSAQALKCCFNSKMAAA